MCKLKRMQTLSTYLRDHGKTQREIARAVGASPSYINELCKELKTPSLKMAFAIERATDGAVLAASWAKPMKAEAAE